MSKEHHSLAELKTLFRVGHFVDFYKATELMAAAITEELKPVTESFINAAWEAVTEPEDYECATRQAGHSLLFAIPTLFKRYAEFMGLLGESLGIETGDDDIMCDDWISDAMPKTRAISVALMELCVEYLSEASARMKEQTGTTPAEVFVQSVQSGESFDQSKIRLGHAAKGLSTVQSKPKS